MYSDSNLTLFPDLNKQTQISFPQVSLIAKMTANGTAKDYSVISQKDPEKDGIEMKVNIL